MGAANADDDTGEEDVPSHPSSGPNAEVALSSAAGAPVIPRRVLHRSDHLSRNEDALRCALVITLLGGSGDGELEFIRATVAHRFEIDEARLTLHPWGPSSFILILPNEELAGIVYNEGRPIVTTTGRLHVMRWTRFLQASAASLSVAVEVELEGIPAHAWELATADVLLDEVC